MMSNDLPEIVIPPIPKNVKSKKYLYVGLILIIASVLLVFAFKHSSGSDVPIVESIKLHPTADELRDRFRRDTVRNILYENKSKDPLFYSKILNSIRNCEWVKSKGLIERDIGKLDPDNLILKESQIFDKNKIFENRVFVEHGGAFFCQVYNGGDFVLIVLLARY